jgi:GNAT superfamily N-acetyltransferase
MPEETELLVRLTDATGFFKPVEIEALQEVLDDYHAANCEFGHVCVTYEDAGDVLGFAYYAPAAMTDRSWYLWWIVVRKELHGRGIGGKLLRHAEDDIRRQQGRVLFIETGSLPHYEPTRQFYLKHAYERHAELKDFYAAGDSMVVFRKALA